MSTLIFHVDSFTSEPFAGNPAAVCVYIGEKDAAWMQDVAAEMNLSETAFVRGRADGSYELRWFTPICEVDLCGHATLATAHVLWEIGLLSEDQTAGLHTRSGVLTAARVGGHVQLDMPAVPNEPAEATKSLERALGVTPIAVFKTQFGTLTEVESVDVVRKLDPKFPALAKVAGELHIVTSASDASEYDFVSRVFCPRIGIDEDPVTGSAHCALGPYWMAKTGKEDFTAYQASKRGGSLIVRVRGNRVKLEGRAVTVARGELV